MAKKFDEILSKNKKITQQSKMQKGPIVLKS